MDTNQEIWKDTQALRTFIKENIGIVSTLRSELSAPSVVSSYDEIGPVATTRSGSKPPLSLSYLDASDFEAASLATLAHLCKVSGLFHVPRLWMFCGSRARGFTGLSTRKDSFRAFVTIAHILMDNADRVLLVPGAKELLQEWHLAREDFKSSSFFRTYLTTAQSDEWLTPQQAAEHVGVSVRTIYNWHSGGFLHVMKNEENAPIEISQASLEAVVAALPLRRALRKKNPEMFTR